MQRGHCAALSTLDLKTSKRVHAAAKSLGEREVGNSAIK